MKDITNIVTVCFCEKQIKFDLTKPRDRELLEILKVVWAGTHASIIIESANTDLEQTCNNICSDPEL